MDKIAVMIGLGQLGRVFAGGLLRTGHVVVPANRGDDLGDLAGRSAPARLTRALRHADAAGLAVPTLRRIAAGQGVT